MSTYHYLKDPRAIYDASFARVRAEVDWHGVPQTLHGLVMRLVHACGMPDIAGDLRWRGDPAGASHAALAAGATVLVDCEMLSHGVIRSRLPSANPVVCTLNDPKTTTIAKRGGITRSLASVEGWGPYLHSDLPPVVAIGNAPTALFGLLERLDAGWPLPAAILGFPVGFVGAAESKQALLESSLDVPMITLLGCRGGSALAAAAVNAVCDAPVDPSLAAGASSTRGVAATEITPEVIPEPAPEPIHDTHKAPSP